MDVKQAFATFVSPPREFGPIPFWFLNDDLEEGELLRQLRALHEAHYGGFVLHARVGLSRRVGYLTDEFFRLARLLVAEAARLRMKVILYDEAATRPGLPRARWWPRTRTTPVGRWECGSVPWTSVRRILASQHGARPARPPRLHRAGTAHRHRRRAAGFGARAGAAAE